MLSCFLCVSVHILQTAENKNRTKLAHYCSSYAVFAGEVGIYMPIIYVPNITVVSGMKYNNVIYYMY
jgi:hypothetical protein